MGFGTAFFDQLDSVGDWGLLVTDTSLIKIRSTFCRLECESRME